MKKEDVLREIRRYAAENDAAPLGKGRFEVETGTRPSAWEGKYWVGSYRIITLERNRRPPPEQGSPIR